MSKKTILVAGLLTAAVLLPTATATSSAGITCPSFSHRGYYASKISATGIPCTTVKPYVKIVIESSTDYFYDRGWFCFQSTSTDGSGHVGCEHGHGGQKFSFHYAPLRLTTVR